MVTRSSDKRTRRAHPVVYLYTFFDQVFPAFSDVQNGEDLVAVTDGLDLPRFPDQLGGLVNRGEDGVYQINLFANELQLTALTAHSIQSSASQRDTTAYRGTTSIRNSPPANINYSTNAFLTVVRPNCAVIFVARTEVVFDVFSISSAALSIEVKIASTKSTCPGPSI